MTVRWTTEDIASELGLGSRATARYAVYRWLNKGLPLDVEIDRKTSERLYLPWQVWSARATDRKGERTDLIKDGQPAPPILHAVADADDLDDYGGANIRILEDPDDWASEIDTVGYKAIEDGGAAEAAILRELTACGYRVVGAPVHRNEGITVPVICLPTRTISAASPVPATETGSP